MIKSLGKHIPRFSMCMLFLNIIVLSLAIINLVPKNILSSFRGWFLSGQGLYWVLVVGAAMSSTIYGTKMQIDGSKEPRPKISNAERDKLWIKRFSGKVLSAGGLGLMLVSFWMSQNNAVQSAPLAAQLAPIAAQSTPIGFYDLMTWLGTFATFVVVVATALVAMYVKRRDDEARHSSAVMEMRQAWINKVRLTLSKLIANGQKLYTETIQLKVNIELATKTRQMLREIQLQLNPTEGHHAVLLATLRGWLHEAGIEDHFRGAIPTPQLHTQTDFDVVTEWLIMQSQLVLKVEWVVTSLDETSVPTKVGRLWSGIERYENKNAVELAKVVPRAMHLRQTEARTLVEGANMTPIEGA